ncbi:MAG: hypothetical protein ACTSWN_11150, partial [Promethearchaeota archaeon]
MEFVDSASKASKFRAENISLETEIETKGLESVDVKFDYFIQKNVKINRYSIVGYIFLPKDLRINKDTYKKEEFFHDFRSFIRFHTPVFPLMGLIKEQNNLSPLNRVKSIIAELASGQKDEEELYDRIIYELKMLAQIIRGNLRNQVVFLLDQCSRGGPMEILVEKIQDTLDTLKRIQSEFYSLQSIFFTVQVPEKARVCYYAADEYVSYYIEHYFTILLKELSKNDFFKIIIPDIQEMITFQQEHRKNMGYRLTFNDEDEDNSKFHYWRQTLKNYFKEVLFLTIKEREKRSKYAQFIGVVGAIIAMG